MIERLSLRHGAALNKCPQVGDAVEKVAFPAKRRVLIERAEQSRLTSCHRPLPGEADLGELAQVLGGCGEVEFVPGAIGSA